MKIQDQYLKKLENFLNANELFLSMVLIGSLAKGNNDLMSDVDLIVICKDGEIRGAESYFSQFDFGHKELFSFKYHYPNRGNLLLVKTIYDGFFFGEVLIVEEKSLFSLKDPHRIIFDKSGKARSSGLPAPSNQDFEPLSIGKEHLPFELIDLAKYYIRGHKEFVEKYLKSLGNKL